MGNSTHIFTKTGTDAGRISHPGYRHNLGASAATSTLRVRPTTAAAAVATVAAVAAVAAGFAVADAASSGRGPEMLLIILPYRRPQKHLPAAHAPCQLVCFCVAGLTVLLSKELLSQLRRQVEGREGEVPDVGGGEGRV